MPSISSHWRAVIYSTITGEIKADMPVAQAPTFACAINDAGSGSVTIPIGGNGVTREQVAQYSRPWEYSAAIVFDNKIIQAGPFISEQYNDGDEYTTGSFVGLRNIFNKRVLLPASWGSAAPNVAAADTTYVNMSLRDMVRTIIQTNISRNGYSLPINFQAADGSGVNTRTYYGYELNLIEDELNNLSSDVNGPEIVFQPRFTKNESYVTHDLIVGSPHVGNLGYNWVWDYGSRGALKTINYARDGSGMATVAYAKGSGDTYSTLIGVSAPTIADQLMPPIEIVNGDHTSVTDQPTINGYAAGITTTNQTPLVTLQANIRPSALDVRGNQTGSPKLGDFALGDNAVFSVQNHRRILDGNYNVRIIGIQSSDADTVTLTLQSINTDAL